MVEKDGDEKMSVWMSTLRFCRETNLVKVCETGLKTADGWTLHLPDRSAPKDVRPVPALRK